MGSTRTVRTLSPRAALGESLRRLAPSAQYTLSCAAMRPLLADDGVASIAAFVAALAYECRCNYRMVDDQAVFTRRALNGT